MSASGALIGEDTVERPIYDEEAEGARGGCRGMVYGLTFTLALLGLFASYVAVCLVDRASDWVKAQPVHERFATPCPDRLTERGDTQEVCSK